MKMLRLRGFRLESLISRGLRSGLRLRRIHRSAPREIQIVSSAGDAARLRDMALQRGIACEETGDSGWDRILRHFLARKTLAAGFLCMFFLLYLFSGRIWLVDISPSEGDFAPETRQQIHSALESLAIRPGCLPPDTESVARFLAAECPSLAHVGVRITGVRLLVSGTQADPIPEIYQPLAARDLLADRDGVVLTVNVLAGQAAVKPGDTVRKGDLLIEGWERVSDEETRGIQALGEVTARVWSEAEACSPLHQPVTRRTGQTRVCSALVGPGIRIPLMPAEPFPQCEEEILHLQVVGMFLPVYIEKIIYHETQTTIETVDQEALTASLKEQAISQASASAPGEILQVWTQETVRENEIRVRAVVESAASIAAPAG